MRLSLCRLLAILLCTVATAQLTGCNDPSSQPPTQAAEPAPATPASTATGGSACPNPPPGGNTPFVATACDTTQNKPARADIVLKPSNLLYCSAGQYALCFWSGPPYKTGKNPNNVPLPCVLEGDIAHCTCQLYTAGPSFVDINGILNQGAYFQTVSVCGEDGSMCANLDNCGAKGDKQGCSTQTQAPVCQYVKNQSPTNARYSLMPAADTLSTYSFKMDPEYRQGSRSCKGIYAGCMTAPCHIPPGQTPTDGELVTCDCPTFPGDYQIQQESQMCTLAPSGQTHYVWSASYTPGSGASSTASGGGK